MLQNSAENHRFLRSLYDFVCQQSKNRFYLDYHVNSQKQYGLNLRYELQHVNVPNGQLKLRLNLQKDDNIWKTFTFQNLSSKSAFKRYFVLTKSSKYRHYIQQLVSFLKRTKTGRKKRARVPASPG